jgi:hypothetical protein
MIKKYLFALVNLVLLFPFILFVWNRYLIIEQHYLKLGVEFDLTLIFKAMKHDILILLVGLLSFIGILFFNQKKTFFFISTFYAAIQLLALILIPSFSFWYITLVISEIIFLWFLIWSNTFSVFENKRLLKLGFLAIGVLLSFLIAYFIR